VQLSAQLSRIHCKLYYRPIERASKEIEAEEPQGNKKSGPGTAGPLKRSILDIRERA
jgi:hypothetical protein